MTDGRIVLRAPSLEDVWDLHEAVTSSLEELTPWMGWAHPGIAREEMEDWIFRSLDGRATGHSYEFVIREAGSERCLGACGLGRIDPLFRKANLGYWVRTDAAGKGIASAAARLVARFGFEQVALERIEIVADVANVASQRAAEKAGAVREGIVRNGMRVRNRQSDAVMYSLVPEDLS